MNAELELLCDKLLSLGESKGREIADSDHDVPKLISKINEKLENWDTMIKYWSKTYTHDENLPSPNTDLSCNICGENFSNVCMLSHNESASFSFINNSREHFKKHGMIEK